MATREQTVDYRDGDVALQGFFAYDDSRPGPLPAILISHAWTGRIAAFDQKARELARLGYAAFALDMYGGGRTGATNAENSALMQPFISDRALLARRIGSAVDAVSDLPQVDRNRIGAMGYCFGGLCVLDLARSGARVRGVVSIHGLLKPSTLPPSTITSKVLVLHGHDDPMAPVEDVVAFEKEMTAAKADWQVHAYGGTMHAFTDPNANDPGFGLVYNPAAERRSWTALLNFFDEVMR